MKHIKIFVFMTSWLVAAAGAPAIAVDPWSNALILTRASAPCVNGQQPYYDKPECSVLYEEIKNLTLIQMQSSINPMVNPSPAASSAPGAMPEMGRLNILGCSDAPAGESIQEDEGSINLGSGGPARRRLGCCRPPAPIPLSAPTCDLQASPAEGWKSGLWNPTMGYQYPAAQQQLALAAKNNSGGSCGDWCELHIDVVRTQECTRYNARRVCVDTEEKEVGKLSFNESGTKCLREKSFFNGFMRRALINATADVLVEMKNSFSSRTNAIAITLTPAPAATAGGATIAPRCAMIAQNILKLTTVLAEQEAAIDHYLDDPSHHFTNSEKDDVRLRGCDDSIHNHSSSTNRGMTTAMVNSLSGCAIKAARTPFAALMSNLALCEIFERGNKDIGQMQMRMFGSNANARDSLFNQVLDRYQLTNGCRQEQIKALRGRNNQDTDRIRKVRINDCYQETYGKILTEMLNSTSPIKDLEPTSTPNPSWFDNWRSPTPITTPSSTCPTSQNNDIPRIPGIPVFIFGLLQPRKKFKVPFLASLFLLFALVFTGCGSDPVQIVEPDHRPTPPVNILETGPSPSIQIALLHQNHDLAGSAEEQVARVRAMVNDTVQKKTTQDRTPIAVNTSAANAVLSQANATSASTKKLQIDEDKPNKGTASVAKTLQKQTSSPQLAGSNEGPPPLSTTQNAEGTNQDTTDESERLKTKSDHDPLVIHFATAGQGANNSDRNRINTNGIDDSNAVKQIDHFGARPEVPDVADATKAQGAELNDADMEDYLMRNRKSDLFAIIHHRYRIIGLEWESERATAELKSAAQGH